MWNRFLKNYFVIASFMTALLLLVIGTQTMVKEPKATAYKGSIFSVATVEPVVTSIDIPVEESTTTTNSTVAEVITTVPETTTTEVVIITVTTRVPRTTTTAPYVYVAPTTIPATRTSGSDGPPRNTTSLVGCIAYYESHWGDISSNIFQFESGTWTTYGGKGSVGNASYTTQEAIFWLAWEDDGHHHWAAQKGRCF